jgi:hypothetical protein
VFGTGEGGVMRSGARREVERGFTVLYRNFGIKIGRAEFGGILVLIWGELL